MWDKSIYHFRGIRSILSLLFYCCWKILFAYNVDPEQMSHNVTSDLGLHCLPITLLRVSGQEWVNVVRLSRILDPFTSELLWKYLGNIMIS